MKTVVLICDGIEDRDGDCFYPDSVVIPERPVPVTRGFSQKPNDFLGTATLTVEGDRLMAEFHFTDPPKGLVQPSVSGHVLGRSRKQGKRRVEAMIKQIGLFAPGSNTDPRVPCVDFSKYEIIDIEPCPRLAEPPRYDENYLPEEDR